MSKIKIERNTKETQITLTLELNKKSENKINTPLPFFNHLLNAMAFHGGFTLDIVATGDIDVDPHHLVEDTGLVLGDALSGLIKKLGNIKRFGLSQIPMDDSLSEVTIDASGRPFLVYKAEYPQEYSGDFQMDLLKEFFIALTNKGGITLHCLCKYGENSHHMAESLFKALGRAISMAYKPGEQTLSTKGIL